MCAVLTEEFLTTFKVKVTASIIITLIRTD